jgi:hypothetical protein
LAPVCNKLNTRISKSCAACAWFSCFTLLSQKLSLDVLKTQIKAFFHLIITIIENAGGQVIKFAGDAIFAIWRQNLESGNNVLSL